MKPKPTEPVPDVRQLEQDKLPDTPFPGARRPPFRVYLDPAIHTRIAQHCRETVEVEICGVLVGRWGRDADGPFVLISESIRGEAATSKFAEVTFTHETWARINHELDTRLAGLAIVGWYHSHPDFGVFLSDRDRFIQEHFFAGPGQVAYVIDPVRNTEGMFAWRDGKPALCPHYWVGDRIQVSTAGGEEARAKAPAPGQPAAAAASTSPDAAGWLPLLSQVLLILVVFLLGYLFAGRLSDLERVHIEQAALARSLVYLKFRPGLREGLGQVSKELREAAQRTKGLAQEHLKQLEEPKEKQEQWQEVLTTLDRSSRQLRQLETTFCLSAEEMQAVLQLLSAGRLALPEDAGNEKSREGKGKKDEQPRSAPDKPADKPAKP